MGHGTRATLRRQIALEERALFPLARTLLAATAAPTHAATAARG